MITHSAVNAGYKVLYDRQKMTRVVHGDESRVFVNLLKRAGRVFEDFGGKNWPLPIYWADGGGGASRTFAKAQANESAPQIGEFAIDIVEDHEVVRISTQTLGRVRGDKTAFFKRQEIRTDMALNVLANRLEQSLFGDESGAVAQIGSIATTVVTLKNPADAIKFAVNRQYVFAPNTDAKGTLRDSAVNRKCTGIDLDNGKITFDEDVSTIASIAANDYIIAEGDAANGSTALALSGLPSWAPTAVASSGDSHFGQDRYNKPLLAGTYYGSGSKSNIKKAIKTGLIKTAARCGGMHGDVALMSFDIWDQLEDEMDRDVLREPGDKAVAGYQYLELNGPKGRVRCVPCPFHTSDDIFVVKLSTVGIKAMGMPVRIDNDDGLYARAISDKKGLEIRGDSHVQFFSEMPGLITRVLVS